MIRFACPVCNAVMKAPADKAGRKGQCPKCGQRLQVPSPSRTVLAKPLPPAKAEEIVHVVEAVDLAPSLRRHHAKPRRSRDDDDGFPSPRRDRRPGRSSISFAWLVPGIVLLSMGVLLVLFFAVVFETTVEQFPGADRARLPRIHNVGLMQDRQVGIIVGGILSGCGMVLVVASRKRT
jgi:DNA-directed RNA polymerase subunit M/transcription elongation factor TFIIS